jgi:hypothetical protein
LSDVIRRRSFFPGYGLCVKENQHRRLAETPAPLMRTLLIAFGHPFIEIGLKRLD